MANRKILPVEGFVEAIIYASGIIALLALVGHPVQEWAVTAAALYAAFRVSREVVTRLVLYVSERLLRYGERVLRKLRAAAADYPPAGRDTVGVKISLVVIAALVFSAVLGLTFGTGGLALNGIGLTPLPGYFPWIAWGLAAGGIVGLSGIFGLTILAFFAVDTLSAAVNPQFSRFHAVTREVDYGLRRGRLLPMAG